MERSSGDVGEATGFVSHYDCSRHDTGWGSPDHQGRLPGIMRAVYADMLTLFGELQEIEGRHATGEELLLAHSPDYLAQVREWVDGAVEAGGPVEVRPGLVVSPATWDASVAAVGSTLQGIDAILDGQVKNAFCAIRPSAADAERETPGRYGFFNQLAVATKYLLNRGMNRVLIIRWSQSGETGWSSLLSEDHRVRHVTMDPAPLGPDLGPAGSAGQKISRPPGAPAYPIDAAIDGEAAELSPDFILLSAGFDRLADDAGGGAGLGPAAYHASTTEIRNYADAVCGGRLLSVLEGGSSPALGSAVVNHVRALAGIEVTGR